MVQKNIARKFIVGFGFINGLWFAIGFTPSDELIKFLQPILSGIHPWLKTLFLVLPLILMISTIITYLLIFRKGGIIGAGAVVLGFIAGALIFKSIILSFILLIVAYIIGLISFKK